MADDIVTRLRKKLVMEPLGDKDSYLTSGDCLDAADEIERLRAAIRHLYFNEGVCYGENCEHCESVFGLCDDEAVRGDA